MTVRLPAGLHDGAGDPLRWAAGGACARLLDRPRDLAPAERALALGLVEYLAETIAADARLPDAAWLGARLARGRDAMRNALGIERGMAPQIVADAFFGAARHLSANEPSRAELALRQAAPVGDASLARLGAFTTPRSLTAALRALRDALEQASFGRP